MTQSAMSNALLRLRDYFGDDLLVKIGRRMELTPRAEALKDAVRDVLVRVEWTIATTADFDPAQSDRQFNVLVSDYTLATLMPKVLALCRKTALDRQVQFPSPGRRRPSGFWIAATSICSSSRRTSARGGIPSRSFSKRNSARSSGARESSRGRSSRGARFAEASHVVMQPPGGAQSLESVFFRQHDLVRRADVMTYSFNTIAAPRRWDRPYRDHPSAARGAGGAAAANQDPRASVSPPEDAAGRSMAQIPVAGRRSDLVARRDPRGGGARVTAAGRLPVTSPLRAGILRDPMSKTLRQDCGPGSRCFHFP